MTTSVHSETQKRHESSKNGRLISALADRLWRVGLVREFGVLFAFTLFTTVLTWPYVTRMRDVVADTGDPYLVAWIFWWDYHQTFTNPLHLFDANVFYPLKYTLAFSEHCYGMALMFFPLYAIGLKPLTVHAVALFLAFPITGYGAFRLGRTLTGSTAVGWIAGIVFAFVPYRFNLMSQAIYVFSPWLPLLFEALVLLVREQSRRRAFWLGFTFFMSGWTTISWFNFSLVPFAFAVLILVTRHGLWRKRKFWLRGAVGLGVASLLLVPFFMPYVLASRLYGFKRTIEEIKANSAWPIHWLSVEARNKLWSNMGQPIVEGWKFKLFPGLLPILFSLAAMLLAPAAAGKIVRLDDDAEKSSRARRWIRLVDAFVVVTFALSIIAIGYDRSDAFLGVFGYLTSETVIGAMTGGLIVRMCLAYPEFLLTAHHNLIETIKSPRRGDAFWLGILLTVIGFCYSLGWNFFFYRLCYDLLPIFRSMRVVSRGAMIAYLGLAILSGLGVKRLAEVLSLRFPRLRPTTVFVLAALLLLIEFNAAPLNIVLGEAYPDAITLRLKKTPMRGGIVELPAGGDFNYRYMLRAADHQKPLIVGTSGFNSPIEDEIEALTRTGAIPFDLMNLLERIPTSYLVIANRSILPERTSDYEVFLERAVTAGRLRFINRFDGRDDLYAVVMNEPDARSEARLPFGLSHQDWAGRIHSDPVTLLGEPLGWAQKLYRVYLATNGAPPRQKEFMADLEVLGRGVVVGSEGQSQQFDHNYREFLEKWLNRESNKSLFAHLDNTQYVARLVANSGISLDQSSRDTLVNGLANGGETRAFVLMKIVDDLSFIDNEQNRSLVMLHYFGYLRRNPDEPPDDSEMRGFKFWLQDLERNHDIQRLSIAFRNTGEYRDHWEKKP
jgi:hypothetical protein